jgi:hypothetical protein
VYFPTHDQGLVMPVCGVVGVLWRGKCFSSQLHGLCEHWVPYGSTHQGISHGFADAAHGWLYSRPDKVLLLCLPPPFQGCTYKSAHLLAQWGCHDTALTPAMCPSVHRLGFARPQQELLKLLPFLLPRTTIADSGLALPMDSGTTTSLP